MNEVAAWQVKSTTNALLIDRILYRMKRNGTVYLFEILAELGHAAFSVHQTGERCRFGSNIVVTFS
jgi:hypothetical protein